MTIHTPTTQRLAMTDRLSVRLLGLFVAVFLVSFIVLWAYGMFESYAASRIAEAMMVAQPKTIVIDPKIQTELAKVMAFDSTPLAASVKDPFNDRSGLAGIAATQGATITSTPNPSGTTGSSGTGGGSRQSIIGSSGGQSGGSVPGAPMISASEATKQRYQLWLGRLSINGDTPIDPSIFAIEDLLPVGIVDGGSGKQEVMFYSEAAGKTLSFPVGTMFYDGWLTELRAEGVVFSSNDARRTIRMRSWARSLRNVG